MGIKVGIQLLKRYVWKLRFYWHDYSDLKYWYPYFETFSKGLFFSGDRIHKSRWRCSSELHQQQAALWQGGLQHESAGLSQVSYRGGQKTCRYLYMFIYILQFSIEKKREDNITISILLLAVYSILALLVKSSLS